MFLKQLWSASWESVLQVGNSSMWGLMLRILSCFWLGELSHSTGALALKQTMRNLSSSWKMLWKLSLIITKCLYTSLLFFRYMLIFQAPWIYSLTCRWSLVPFLYTHLVAEHQVWAASVAWIWIGLVWHCLKDQKVTWQYKFASLVLIFVCFIHCYRANRSKLYFS